MSVWSHPTTRYLRNHWKLGVHLALHTKRFGVNNQWWSPFDSILGRPTKEILYGIVTVRPIIINIKAMLIRAYACGLMAPEELIHIEPVVKCLGKFIDLKMLDMHMKFTRKYYKMLPKERRIYD